ncbi:hypothetical protein RGQ15_16360 [Paracoccus sp. MBLB3053]|uniref:Uncharacterized protein n=1 Tax=Paracoccus aurantius TaxID=3073814 RepID=A0ABU2HVR1_9RHOB|nr:hypothetical protein [Paracoccus sp. MBLB3053]MDS9469139.1 hypothetical protein [Paracoccus sp. MBLB3053]
MSKYSLTRGMHKIRAAGAELMAKFPRATDGLSRVGFGNRIWANRVAAKSLGQDKNEFSPNFTLRQLQRVLIMTQRPNELGAGLKQDGPVKLLTIGKRKDGTRMTTEERVLAGQQLLLSVPAAGEDLHVDQTVRPVSFSVVSVEDDELVCRLVDAGGNSTDLCLNAVIARALAQFINLTESRDLTS